MKNAMSSVLVELRSLSKHSLKPAAGLSILWLAAACGPILLGQPADMADGSHKGFKVALAGDKVLDAFADFNRQSSNRAWEKAFNALDLLFESDPAIMMPSDDGFVVPLRERIFNAVTGLDSEGREAFRVFYGPRAKQLWDGVASMGPGKGLETAQRIFDFYFLTPPAVQAADWLGDAYFEKGEFIQAETYWSAILDFHSVSTGHEAKLQVKRALALFRAGETAPFQRVQQTIQSRLPGQEVVIGGKSWKAGEYVSRLEPGERTSEKPVPVASQSGSTQTSQPLASSLAEDREPQWQFPFLSESAKSAAQSTNNDYYSGMMHSVGNYVPPMARDEERLYCNWLGLCFALDLQTGKLLWRTDKFSKLTSQLQQFRHGSAYLPQYSIHAGNGIVVAISISLDRLNHWQEPYRMIAYAADTGEVKWNTQNISELSDRSFLGEPLFRDDHFLIFSNQKQAAKLELGAYALEDGKELWRTPLGDAVPFNNPRNSQPIMPMPRMEVSGDSLFILTNNGSLLKWDLNQRKLDWTFCYRPPDFFSQGQQPIFYGQPQNEALRLHSDGGLILDGDALYFKEARGERLYALNVAKRELIWHRPVAEAATLVGIDEENLYLLSGELMAIDRKTRGLRWSIVLPVKAGGSSAVVGERSVYVFTSRGIYELSKENGDAVQIFRGNDLSSLGGFMTILDGLNVTLSNQAVTAYPAALANTGGRN